MISRNGTPSHDVSNLVQRVTQCMSVLTVLVGSATNCCQVSSAGCSTSPEIRKRQVAGLNCGTFPTCSTGKSRDVYWPGGNRCAKPGSIFTADLHRAREIVPGDRAPLFPGHPHG